MMIRSESSQNLDFGDQKRPSEVVAASPDQIDKAAWLVSVRDLSELGQALQFDVNIIDFKEPSDKPTNGPLAPVASEIWRSAVDRVAELDREVLLSAALGEWQQGVAIAKNVPRQFAFAKIGPSECGSVDELSDMWRQTQTQLNDNIELVAVAYADAQGCPDVLSVMKAAAKFGLKRFLIDTFAKDGRNTVEILGRDGLAELATTAQSLKLWWTLAGSVTSDHISTLQNESIHPDCFGVRGDICDSQRTGCLSIERMKAWTQALAVS